MYYFKSIENSDLCLVPTKETTVEAFRALLVEERNKNAYRHIGGFFSLVIDEHRGEIVQVFFDSEDEDGYIHTLNECLMTLNQEFLALTGAGLKGEFTLKGIEDDEAMKYEFSGDGKIVVREGVRTWSDPVDLV